MASSSTGCFYMKKKQLFDYFFSPILKKLDDNEYIIGLYGECDKYIIAFTNRLNIIKYYNQNYIKTGVYSQLVDIDCNARDDKNYYLYTEFYDNQDHSQD